MEKKSTSSQTGKLKIGRKEDVLARKQKMLTLPPTIITEDSDLSINNRKTVKILRILLIINLILSLILLIILVFYSAYFNNCIYKTFGPIISLTNKLYFSVVSIKSVFVSIYGLFATTYHLKSNLALYAKILLLLLSISLLTVWNCLHEYYLINPRVYKSKDVCTPEEQTCWDKIQRTLRYSTYMN